MSIFRRKNDNAEDLPMYTDSPSDSGNAASEGGLRSKPFSAMVLSIVLAIILICVTGFMAYRVYAVNSSNGRLENRVQRDTKLQKSEDEYESETDELNSESENLIDRYGAGNTPEKTIMFLVNLSSTSGLDVTSIQFGDEENVTVDENGKKLKGAAKAPDPTKESDSEETDSPDADAADSTAASGTSDSAASQNQDQSSANQSSDKSSDKKSDTSDGKYYLYRYQVTFSYTGSYSDLKEAIQFIEDYGERVTVNDMTSTYDETTQELTGSITLNMYTLTGTAKQYTAPSVSGSVGNADIFGVVGGSDSSSSAASEAGGANIADNLLTSSLTGQQ